MMQTDPQFTAEFFTVSDGFGIRKLAYQALKGAEPAVVWLGGFRSDMRATKAEALANWARENGRAMLRFDYSGHGESEGTFTACTLSQWLGDTLMMIERFAGTAPVLVGSSMGGWIALLAARQLKTHAASAPSALVLIAPAVDFTEHLMWDQFSQDIRREILDKGHWMRPTAYAPQPYPITRALIEDGRKHLMLDKLIDPGCPVTILQGMQDPDVPWSHAMKLIERLPASNVTATFIKDGDHRLSRDADINVLVRAIEAAS